MKRKTIIWLIVAAVVVGGIVYMKLKGAPPTEVSVGAVSSGDIEELISASGSIESETLVKISSDVSGEITHIFVDIGDTVHVGQPLVRIRPDNYQSAAERARAGMMAQEASSEQTEASIRQAELRLAKAKADLARVKNLVAKEVSSEADLIAAQSTYDVAQRELEAAKSSAQAAKFNVRSAKASLKDAELTLSKTEILSPINGSVLNLISKRGERVVGTAQMSGTTIMSLAAINDLQVRIQLNENDVNRVRIGQEARVRVDAAEDTVFRGVVKNVSNINKDKTTSDAVTEYEAVISLPAKLNGPKLTMLKIGMSASVDILTNSKKDVLVAPVQSVLFKTDSSKPNPDGSYPDYEYVYVVKNKEVSKRVVKTGISNSAMIEVVNGLKKGDTVATGPYDALTTKLNDKMKVATKAKTQP
ncbi:efflux RND transporter periplasmic adaptor subunit [Nostoc sp. NIES-2111]